MILLKVQKQVKVNNMLVKDTYMVDKTVKKSKGIINTKFRTTMVMGAENPLFLEKGTHQRLLRYL